MSKLEQAEKALQAKLQEKGWSSDDDSDMDEGDGGDVGANSSKNAGKGTATRAVDKSTGGKKKLVRDHDASKKNKRGSSVLYIGHLPREFGEYELKKLFSQFGTVRRVRVARSRRTGGHKGHAFVEFASPDVAAIVAETFAGYLLMGKRRLVCHVVPPEQVNVRRMFAKPPDKRKAKEQPPVRTLSQMQVITDRLLEREKAKRKKLAELGIEYEFPGYEAGKSAATTTTPTGKSKEKARAAKEVVVTSTENAEQSSEKKSRRKESASSMELEGEEETPKSRKKKRKESDSSLEKELKRQESQQQSSHKESKSMPEKKATKRKESDSSDQRPSSASKRLEPDMDGRRAKSLSPAQSRMDSTLKSNSSSAKKQSKGGESGIVGKGDYADPGISAKESKPKKASKRETLNVSTIDETPTKAGREERTTDDDNDEAKARPVSEKKHKKEKKSKKDKHRRASVP